MKVNNNPKNLPATDFPDLIAFTDIYLTQISSFIKRGYRITTVIAIPRNVNAT
jgi:hypothetical protein